MWLPPGAVKGLAKEGMDGGTRADGGRGQLMAWCHGRGVHGGGDQSLRGDEGQGGLRDSWFGHRAESVNLSLLVIEEGTDILVKQRKEELVVMNACS